MPPKEVNSNKLSLYITIGGILIAGVVGYFGGQIGVQSTLSTHTTLIDGLSKDLDKVDERITKVEEKQVLEYKEIEKKTDTFIIEGMGLLGDMKVLINEIKKSRGI
ncbi:MAG: hypothetical protein WCK31_04790 [bacterium]